MSEGASSSYKLDHTNAAKEQIHSIAALAAQAGKSAEFLAILHEAVARLRADPHAWGDPERRSKFVDSVYYHGILRPVVFRYVIYDGIQTVVLLSLDVFADFS